MAVPGTDSHFIYVQQPTALITFDDFVREYGLPNPTFTFTVSGAILGDSAANVASGVGVTTATIGSNVGSYPITGQFTSAAGYRLQFVPGTLGITPANLVARVIIHQAAVTNTAPVGVNTIGTNIATVFSGVGTLVTCDVEVQQIHSVIE